MESKNQEVFSTDAAEEQSAQPFQEFFDKIEKLKEIDIFGIEPFLPPTWKEGRF
jgi:hypothetical protein